jgi:hypothetical protein
MKVGAENKRQMILAGVVGFFALLSLYPLYQDFFGGPPPVTPPPPVIRDAAVPGAGASSSIPVAARAGAGGNAVKVGTSAAALDPTLHMGGMLRAEAVVYNGNGRNIFSAGPYLPPTRSIRIPGPILPPRPSPVLCPPNCPRPPAPLGPPAIRMTFFGTASAPGGIRRALLLSGDNVFIASPGDIVDRRYRVISIATNSIVIEDMPNINRQTLPLLTN